MIQRIFMDILWTDVVLREIRCRTLRIGIQKRAVEGGKKIGE